MLTKRIIGVVTVKGGIAVQSFAYRTYLPIGQPEHLISNLDKWGVDEILLLAIDRTREGLGPDLDLLRRISSMSIGTPLSYGGGIGSVRDAVAAIAAGADRLCIDSILQKNPSEVCRISDRLGSQALIGCMPISITKQNMKLYDYIKRTENPVSESLLNIIENNYLSELMLVDYTSNGQPGCFNLDILNYVRTLSVSTIVLGGIFGTTQIDKILASDNISALAFGNVLNYRENSIESIKKNSVSLTLRPHRYLGGDI